MSIIVQRCPGCKRPLAVTNIIGNEWTGYKWVCDHCGYEYGAASTKGEDSPGLGGGV